MAEGTTTAYVVQVRTGTTWRDRLTTVDRDEARSAAWELRSRGVRAQVVECEIKAKS